MGRKSVIKNAPEIWHLYKFPAPNNIPKYAVAQVEGETTNWTCANEMSSYRTTHRHPELEKLDDVEYELFDASTLNPEPKKKGKK